MRSYRISNDTKNVNTTPILSVTNWIPLFALFAHEKFNSFFPASTNFVCYVDYWLSHWLVMPLSNAPLRKYDPHYCFTSVNTSSLFAVTVFVFFF